MVQIILFLASYKLTNTTICEQKDRNKSEVICVEMLCSYTDKYMWADCFFQNVNRQCDIWAYVQLTET